MKTYFYRDSQGFAIVYDDNINFLVNSKKRIKIYIPGIKTYTKSYIFDNLNQSDVVMGGFYNWMFSSNLGNNIYENLINDLGNHGLSKKFIVIQYELPRQLYKPVSIESLKYFITRLDLVDTYEEKCLSYSEDCRYIDYIYDTRLHKPKLVSKEIVLRLSHLYIADNLKTVLLNMVCKNFRELVKRLDRSNKYLISRVKDDFFFKMSTLLIYFKKKKLLKD